MCTLISTYISTGVDSDARVQNQSQPHLARPTSIADICPLNTGAYTTAVVVYLKMTPVHKFTTAGCVIQSISYSSVFSKFTTAGCVCVFSSHSFWTSSSLDVPAGVTQEEGHTLLHTLKCCCTLLENRVDVSFIAEPRSVNTSLYNNNTSNKSAFRTILPCDLNYVQLADF